MTGADGERFRAQPGTEANGAGLAGGRRVTALVIVVALAACAAPTEQAAMFARAGDGLAAAERRSGDLKLACDPFDSEVWLDGVPIGSCTEFSGRRGLSLGQRMRKVEVRKEGYRSFETFVEPDGTRAALTVTLAPSNTGGGP